MTKQDLGKIVNYIVDQALRAVRENTHEKDLPVDYMGIFSKDGTEFTDLVRLVSTLGKLTDKTATQSGSTFLLNEPLNTPAGPLKALKVREPDPTRPQRGAPDFQVTDYESFKKKYLSGGHNFALVVRKDYEMLELKGVDVLVYFPSKSFDERQLMTN